MELDLYKKLDKLFNKIQTNNTKNVFDSRVNGMSTITRVISVGDKNTREIISDIYNKKLFRITKNGESYCQIERQINGDYSINNISKLFQNDYLDNNCILVNNITGLKKVITLDYLINNGFNGNGNYDLITIQHNPLLIPETYRNFRYLINNPRNIKTKRINFFDSKQNFRLLDTMKPRIFKHFSIEKLLNIKFISGSEDVNLSLKAKKTDYFSKIENILYNYYPKYREYKNFFIVNGNKIDTQKTLEDNKIKDNDVIVILIVED